jgi:PAS domain S-box-containing protein
MVDMAEAAWLLQDSAEPQRERGEEPGERERVLFESCPLPLWIYDVDADLILHANDAACRKYGYTHEEFAGLALRDFQPDDAQGLATNPLGLAALDVFVTGCWRHRCRDGAVIHVEVTANDMVFLGRRARFVCPNDVTQRLQSEAKLRERKAALRRAQDMAGLSHHIIGPDGVFESWADSLPGLLGVDEGGIPRTARDWLPWVHPDDRERCRTALIDAGRRGAGCDIEYRLLRADGDTIHVREVIEPVHDRADPTRGRWFCTLQDVSAQKHAEEQIRRHNEELEARVNERTMQLQVSNCELAFATAAAERANRSKSEFLSNMSHELRTPLNAIVGFGQLLAMPGLMERDPAQRDAYIRHIVDGGRHLLTLINEILNLAQIEAGKIEVRLERVALGPLLAECDAMVDPLADKRAISMRFPRRCELHVQADRMRLKQVLLNLVSNAIKYNRPQGEVEIDCVPLGDVVRIHVRDTGVGLTEQELESLFEAFNRLGQDTSSEEGSGIGLVVTKRLIELMGGRIFVSSEPGVGSVFSVELPLAGQATGPALSDFADADHAWMIAPVNAEDRLRLLQTDLADRTATILCVDDDSASLRLLQQVLSTLPGVHLLTATNGRLGLEMALAHAPALIIMDNNMPEMSGREAQSRLQADERTAAIPVIAVSANAMPGEAASGLAAGYFRYLTKPFDVAELLQAVGDALSEARAQALR